MATADAARRMEGFLLVERLFRILTAWKNKQDAGRVSTENATGYAQGNTPRRGGVEFGGLLGPITDHLR